MSDNTTLQEFDLPIRHFVYRHFVDYTRPPTIEETAVAFALTDKQVEAAYKRLNDHHFFFLKPGTSNIRMANPFSAVSTNFAVHVGQTTYWANCAWDMLGIPAALNKDVIIKAQFSDTQASTTIIVQDGQVISTDGGVVHFPLPLRQWYDDLILT